MKEILVTDRLNQNMVKSSLIELKSFYGGMNFTLHYIIEVAMFSPVIKSLHPCYLSLHMKLKTP